MLLIKDISNTFIVIIMHALCDPSRQSISPRAIVIRMGGRNLTSSISRLYFVANVGYIFSIITPLACWVYLSTSNSASKLLRQFRELRPAAS